MAKRTPPDREDNLFARAVPYQREETSFGYYRLQIRGLTLKQRDALLKAIPKIIGAPITGEDGDYDIVGRGRHDWSGSPFNDAEDCLTALQVAIGALLTAKPPQRVSRGKILDQLALDRDDRKIAELDESRVSAWCTKAGTDLRTLKTETAAAIRAHLPLGTASEKDAP
jgi:hypothetical protein